MLDGTECTAAQGRKKWMKQVGNDTKDGDYD